MLKLKHQQNIYERWYNRVKLEKCLFSTLGYKELLKIGREKTGKKKSNFPNSSIQYSNYTCRMNGKEII